MRASRVLGCGVSQLCVGFGILLQTRGTADSERDGGLVHFKWEIEYGFGVFGGMFGALELQVLTSGSKAPCT